MSKIYHVILITSLFLYIVMVFKKGHKPHNKGHVKVGSHFKAKPKKK